jgi:hypothetical protein
LLVGQGNWSSKLNGRRAPEIGAKQRAYLRDTLHELNITASRMAGMLGMAPSTFTRFINLPDSSEKTMHPATIDKVEKLRQVNSDSPFPTTAQGSWATLREEQPGLTWRAEIQRCYRRFAA